MKKLKTVDKGPTKAELKTLHTVIKVTEYRSNAHNTAISALMIFVNEANSWKEIPKSIASDFFLF